MVLSFFLSLLFPFLGLGIDRFFLFFLPLFTLLILFLHSRMLLRIITHTHSMLFLSFFLSSLFKAVCLYRTS